MDATLRPCPFCGGAPRIETLTGRALGKSWKVYMIRCDKCRLEFPTYNDKDVAIERWNRRVGSE